MEPRIHPYLTQPDLVVLENLFRDVQAGVSAQPGSTGEKPPPEMIEKHADEQPMDQNHDKEAVALLRGLNNPNSPSFQPTVFATWDEKDIPEFLNNYIIRPYARAAKRIVRHPTDVVFLTHIILYMTVNVGSAIFLFYSFTYLHGVVHAAYTLWCAGSFTLMLHNHIHNNGA